MAPLQARACFPDGGEVHRAVLRAPRPRELGLEEAREHRRGHLAQRLEEAARLRFSHVAERGKRLGVEELELAQQA